MRLTILDRARGFATKTLFMVIRAMPRQPVLDVIKLVRYRADFYGLPPRLPKQQLSFRRPTCVRTVMRDALRWLSRACQAAK